MENKKEVKFRKSASDNIADIAYYIEQKGYSVTAENLVDRFYEFGASLSSFPAKYPRCRHKLLAGLGFHCAVFLRSFVFVYKIRNDSIEVYNVIRAASLK